MTSATEPMTLSSPGFVSPPVRQLTLSLSRDGQQTPSLKKVFLLDSSTLAVAAVLPAIDGVLATAVFKASAVAKPWLLLIHDTVEPLRAVARYPDLSDEVSLFVDINDGSGAVSGSQATLAARVRVEGLSAAREVLAVERQTDGTWRIAGNLRTAEGDLDLRVTGGAVYALAIDDYGSLYQPNLAVEVDDLIRPTTFAGWLYRITQAGSLPASEPAWWDGNLVGPQDLGSARAEVVRYYRPLAHGPITVEAS